MAGPGFPRTPLLLSALLGAPLLAVAAQFASAQGSATPAPALTFSAPDPARVAPLVGRCQGCHGTTWQGGRGPALAGRSAEYLRTALAQFRAKQRSNPNMQNVAASLTDQNIADLAAAISGDRSLPAAPAAQTAAASPPATAPAAAVDGRKLYTVGDPARDVIACAVCHGETGQGEGERLGLPDLRGKSAQSVTEALTMYRALKPDESVYPDAMRIATKALSDADIRALATYVSTLK